MQDGPQDISQHEVDPVLSALRAAAAVRMPDVPLVHTESSGTILIYGRDQIAVEAGELLKEHLDVTVLIIPPVLIAESGTPDFPVVQGKIATATGHFGAFDLVVDDFAEPDSAFRGEPVCMAARNGAKSHCDIILDLSGGAPLFA